MCVTAVPSKKCFITLLGLQRKQIPFQHIDCFCFQTCWIHGVYSKAWVYIWVLTAKWWRQPKMKVEDCWVLKGWIGQRKNCPVLHFFFPAVLLAILAMNEVMTPLSINKASTMLVLSLYTAEYEIYHISGKETFFVPFLPDTVWYVTLSWSISHLKKMQENLDNSYLQSFTMPF